MSLFNVYFVDYEFYDFPVPQQLGLTCSNYCFNSRDLRLATDEMSRGVRSDSLMDDREQFTVVVMTYKRLYVLEGMLDMFKGVKEVKAVRKKWRIFRIK